MMNNFQHRKSILFLSRRLFIVLAALASVFINCEEERIDVVVDSYLSFLEVTTEQEPEIKPQLEEVDKVLHKYYSLIDAAIANRSRISKEKALEYKLNMMSELYPVLKSLDKMLDDGQRILFYRTELFYYFNENRRSILNNYTVENDFKSKREVNLAKRSGDLNELDKLKTASEWTIYFGQNMFPSVYNRSGNSVSKKARRNFPIGIQATLVNDNSSTGKKENEFVEIRTIIYSRLHPNFVDLSNWVVYLELPDGTMIEPKKAVTQDREWFVKSGLLLTNRLPEYLLPITMRSTRNSFENMSESSSAPLDLHSSYYQLFFPKKVNGKELISSGNEYLNIIFLKEVGSKELAYGSWLMQWQE